jgi:hypothetical protein
MTIKLSELAIGQPLTGDELVEIVQDGQSRRTTIAQIQAPPQLQATYVTMTANPDLPNERILTMGTGLQLADGGAGGAVTLSATTLLTEPQILYDGASNPVLQTGTGAVQIFEPGDTDYLSITYSGTSVVFSTFDPAHTIDIASTDLTVTGGDIILDTGSIVLGTGSISAGAGLLVPYEIPIQWEDATPTAYDMLVFAGFVPGDAPVPDPNLGNVSLLVTGETALNFTGSFSADIGGVGWTYTGGDPFSGAELGYVTTSNFKNGLRSIFCKGETGATFEGFVGPAQNSTEAAVFFPIGLEEFTIEFWLDPSTEYKGLNPDGRWSNNFPVLSSYNTQSPSAQSIEMDIEPRGWFNLLVPISTGRVVVLAQVDHGQGYTSTTWMNESWHHFAFTRESDGEFRAYFDGVLRAITGFGLQPSQATLPLVQPSNAQTVNIGCKQRNGSVPDGQGAAAYIDDFRITKGVARYLQGGGTVGTTVFTPPGAPDGTAKTNQFIVGDPGYEVLLDGLVVTSNADVYAPRVVSGDPGTEGDGISLDGTTYFSSSKVSDIGGTNLAQFILHRHSTTIAPVILSARSNSDTSAHTLVTDGQSLLWMIGAGWDGVAYQRSAEIEFEVDGVAAADDMPGRIILSTTPGGTKVPVERLRVSSEGGLYLSEIGTADADLAGKGQVWVRNDTPNALMFTDDAGTDFVIGGAGVTPLLPTATPVGRWTYDATSQTMSNPGSGFIRFNNVTLTSSNVMAIHYIDADGLDWEQHILDAWGGTATGILVRMSKVGDPQTYVVWSINSDNDQLTHNNPYINLIAFEGTWANGDEIYIEIQTQPYVMRPTTDHGIYSASAILSGQPLNGLIQSARLLHDPALSACNLDFVQGSTFRISHNFSNTDMSGSAIFQVRSSNRFEIYGSTNSLPRLTVTEGAISIGHANDSVAGNGAPMLRMHERTDAGADEADWGQVWVKGNTPNVLMFTDDTGVDHNLIDIGAAAQTISTGWSTTTGGSVTLAANAGVFYTEQTADDAPGTGQGQIWVKDNTAQVLYFTDDTLNDYYLAGPDFDSDGANFTVRQNVLVRGGHYFQVYDAGDDDFLDILHTGTVCEITTAGTGVGSVPINFTDLTLQEFTLQDFSLSKDAPTVVTNAVTLTYANGPVFEIDLEPATGTVTVTLSGGPLTGEYGQITVKVQQDGTAARTITWAGGTFRWAGGTAHPMNPTLDGFSIFTFESWDAGTTWYGSGADYS